MTARPIKRTLKANAPQPEIFVFQFDTDSADGYAATGGVVVTMASAGVYTCQLPKQWKASQLLMSVANIVGEAAKTATVTGETIETGSLTVTTYSSGTPGLQAGETVSVLLVIGGQ